MCSFFIFCCGIILDEYILSGKALHVKVSVPFLQSPGMNCIKENQTKNKVNIFTYFFASSI